LIDRGGVKIEQIVSPGQASPLGFWYDEPTIEWVLLVAGSAGLRFEGDDDILELRRGDWVEIPARTPRRVDWTNTIEPTIWLAVHFPLVWRSNESQRLMVAVNLVNMRQGTVEGGSNSLRSVFNPDFPDDLRNPCTFPPNLP
jgi:cupin 2 domain-containing protein